MYLHICFYVHVCTYIYLYIYLYIWWECVFVCPYTYMPTTHTLLQNLHSNPTLLYKPTYLHANPTLPSLPYITLYTYTHILTNIPYQHYCHTITRSGRVLPLMDHHTLQYLLANGLNMDWIWEPSEKGRVFQFSRQIVTLADCRMIIALNTMIIAPKRMYTFLCICIYIYICVCIYIYVSVRLCVCVLMCLCVCVRRRIWASSTTHYPNACARGQLKRHESNFELITWPATISAPVPTADSVNIIIIYIHTHVHMYIHIHIHFYVYLPPCLKPALLI